MPTITLSWADLALCGLTAGLIGAVVLIGRSHSSTSINPKISTGGSKAAGSKKKKNRNKKPSSTTDPSSTSVTSPKQTANSGQSLASAEPQKDGITKVGSNASQAADQRKKTKSAQKPVDSKAGDDGHPEFPPLQASNKNQNQPKRPFAERHKQPVRKTVVDDMIDQDIEKPLKMARVMNIVDPEPEVRLSPPSDPEDGWEKVPDSKRSRIISIPTSNGSPAAAAASSVQSSSVTTSAASQQKPSKRQRQNAKKKEEAKLLKAAQEAERLSQLSSHKRQQERLRMESQNHPNQTNSGSNKSQSKKIGGGMKATMAEDGRLIWE